MRLPSPLLALVMILLPGLILSGIGCGSRPNAPAGDPSEPIPGPAPDATVEFEAAGPGGNPVPPIPEPVEPPTEEELEAMSASELVQRATALLNQAIREEADPDWDEQIRLLQAAVEEDSEDRNALLMLANALEQKGILLALRQDNRAQSMPYLYRAADRIRVLRDREEPLDDQERELAAMAFYNEACNYAIDGEPEKAMESLRDAVDMDFSHPVILDDEELDPLRDRDDFNTLLDLIRDRLQPVATPAPGPAGL